MHTKLTRAPVIAALSAALILVVCAASPAPPETKVDAACEQRIAAQSETTGEEASGEASAESSASSTPPLGPLAAPGATFQLSTEVADPDPKTSSNCREARALFEQALVPASDGFAITIAGSNDVELKERIKKKMKLAEKTREMLEDVIEKKCPHWTTAALFHIGLQHANFAETVAESYVPSRLTDKQAKIYCGLLFDRSGKEFCKAIAAWKQAVEVGEENEVSNTWTDKAADYVKTGRLDKQVEVDACVERDRVARSIQDADKGGETNPEQEEELDENIESEMWDESDNGEQLESVEGIFNDPLMRRALKACETDPDCPYPPWRY
ncbi:MAG: hypothetical protein ACLFVJ_12900 [Persicimonas sp.]